MTFSQNSVLQRQGSNDDKPLADASTGVRHYPPNRDNAGYDSDARMTASSLVAFIFTIPEYSLVITGKDAKTSKP